MSPRQIVLMLKYYFGSKLSNTQRDRVLHLPDESRSTSNDRPAPGVFSPAEVEDICAENDDVEARYVR